MARPTAYKPEYAEQAKKLAVMGLTDAELADVFGVSVRTLYNWKATYPALAKALKVGKKAPDDRVERSLYQRAVGYEYESEKVFQHNGTIVRAKTREHVPASVTAAIFWLKNRAGWKDVSRQELTGPAGAPIETANRTVVTSATDPIEAARIYQEMMKAES
jgi:hypothetical protein